MIVIREAKLKDCAGIARVQVDSYQSAYAGIFPEGYIAHFTYAEQEGDWKKWFGSNKDEMLYLAENQPEEICGYCLFKIKKDIYPGYDAEIVALHVNRRIHRQGVGSVLLDKAMQELQIRGCTSVMLWTLRDNPIRNWYERLGGKAIGEKKFDVDDCEIVEIAYGWKDINHLAKCIHRNNKKNMPTEPELNKGS